MAHCANFPLRQHPSLELKKIQLSDCDKLKAVSFLYQKVDEIHEFLCLNWSYLLFHKGQRMHISDDMGLNAIFQNCGHFLFEALKLRTNSACFDLLNLTPQKSGLVGLSVEQRSGGKITIHKILEGFLLILKFLSLEQVYCSGGFEKLFDVLLGGFGGLGMDRFFDHVFSVIFIYNYIESRGDNQS